MNVLDLFAGGGYLEWIEELGLPAANEERIRTAQASADKTNDFQPPEKIVARQKETVKKWLEETGQLFEPFFKTSCSQKI